jgi:cellulose synthase/poly-beta-1,6-N-acetylglucosamine synthase-like glycosyltransferase
VESTRWGILFNTLFILVSTIIVFFALIHSIITAQLVESGREKLALKLDWVSRFIFPAVFVYTVIYILVLPRDVQGHALWSELIPSLMELLK